MKFILIILSSLISFSAMAAWNEVECQGVQGTKRVTFEVQRGSTHFKYAKMTVTSEGEITRFNYNVQNRWNPNFGRANYDGPGVGLEVDFWPDKQPQWGRMYRGTLRATDLQNPFLYMHCRYM